MELLGRLEASPSPVAVISAPARTMEIFADAAPAVIGYALRNYQDKHGPRNSVVLTVRDLAFYLERIPAKNAELPPEIAGRLYYYLAAAAQQPERT